MNKQLAKITKVNFNIKERGILMFHVMVDYEECGSQGVGGLCLDEYDKDKKERVGTAYGCEMIRQLMITLDVDNFEEAKGNVIWVLGEGEGFSFKPLGLQSLNVHGKQKTMIFKDIFDEFTDKKAV